MANGTVLGTVLVLVGLTAYVLAHFVCLVQERRQKRQWAAAMLKTLQRARALEGPTYADAGFTAGRAG